MTWWFDVFLNTKKGSQMKKYIWTLSLLFIPATAHSVATLQCRCSNGTSVAAGETCPGELKPCGSGATLDECVSTDWMNSITPGYQEKVTATGTILNCTRKTSYRCAAGYYGQSTNGTTGCTPCPAPGTSANGATAKTSCYVVSGTVANDTSGQYNFTNNCFYTN